MGSRSKTRTTFSKLDRERKVIERRIEKDRRKETRKRDAAVEAAAKLEAGQKLDEPETETEVGT